MLSPTTMPLEQELQTYHEHKDHLLEKYKDRYVLIKGDEVVADFESRGDALREGYKRFGHEAFLVKKVEEMEQVNFFSRTLALFPFLIDETERHARVLG